MMKTRRIILPAASHMVAATAVRIVTEAWNRVVEYGFRERNLP